MSKQKDHQVQPPPRTLSVEMSGMQRVGARPAFLDYVVALWDFRHFIAYDARSRVQSGTDRDRLGSAWHILNPLFNGLIFYLIFGIILGTGQGIPNFIGYLVIGVFLFQFSTRAITAGSRSISSNRSVIQAFNFPRATLPVAVNLRELLSAVLSILVMLVLVLLIPPVEAVTPLWLLVVPAVALQFVFNLGISMLLSRIVTIVHDVVHLIGFVMRAWMYTSAVFFSIDRFSGHPVIYDIMKLNPLFNVLDIVRDCVLYATVPDWRSWAILLVWALGSLAVGFVFFWRGEESYGRD